LSDVSLNWSGSINFSKNSEYEISQRSEWWCCNDICRWTDEQRNVTKLIGILAIFFKACLKRAKHHWDIASTTIRYRVIPTDSKEHAKIT